MLDSLYIIIGMNRKTTLQKIIKDPKGDHVSELAIKLNFLCVDTPLNHMHDYIYLASVVVLYKKFSGKIWLSCIRRVTYDFLSYICYQHVFLCSTGRGIDLEVII